ncbi:NmrA-domain-containing protein [Exidia glandulosa HHB12029]|uniref:NmrA-domain-containing protein n=1 Tax=Exidia glandulosa HHB12029 TaxID=1314781 RepID=A0A165FDA3_EXIGL|nr:NmrA-domain-containing protein [Exidia glandulosa HHB12029]
MARIATVFGATGIQGGAVVRTLLKDGTFTPRAVTRNANSDAARALAAQGAEVVEANLGDYEAVKKAVTGAEVVFGVTIPDFTGAGATEYDQGKNMVDAAKETGVRFFVWSSLTDFTKLSGGKYSSPVFDGKARVDDYLLASGVPHSVLLTGGFLENWTRSNWPGQPQLTENGEIALRTIYLPGTTGIVSWIGHDMGPCVLALIKQYDAGKLNEVNGQKYVMGTERYTIEDNFRKIEEGNDPRAAMVRETAPKCMARTDTPFQIYVLKEFPWYPDMTIPDPRLIAMGVKFGTVEEFVRTELKSHLGL